MREKSHPVLSITMFWKGENTVAIMIVSTPIGTAPHTNNPFRIKHLVIALAGSRCHFISDRACHNHDVGLAARDTENDTQAVLIVPRHEDFQHLKGTVGKPEAKWPH